MDYSKKKLTELHSIITRMSIEVIYMTVLPEFGVQWPDVRQAVRNARLPMTPASVAKVLCTHAGRTMTDIELNDVVSVLRLKLIATQTRTWHVINLIEPTSEVPVHELAATLPSRVLQALRSAKNHQNKRPLVQSVKLGDLIYMSVQLVSATKDGPVLFVATPPGEPVALVSSVHSRHLLKYIVQGIGYEEYSDACLSGPDVASLLRIHNRARTAAAERLVPAAPYRAAPVVSSSGVDYTASRCGQRYVEATLGPAPPLLTSLTVHAARPFFDPDILDKTMKIKMSLQTENVAETLTAWAAKGAISPTSEIFNIFHNIKSNKISYNADDD